MLVTNQENQAQTHRVWQIALNDTMKSEADCFLSAGEKHFREGEMEIARKIFEVVLLVDPGNERATFNLCEMTQDYSQMRNLLEIMLQVHPESKRGLKLLEDVDSRCIQLEELEELVKTSSYLKNWSERENIHQERLKYSQDRRPSAISKLGYMLIELGYVNQEQIETAINLQTMLNRLGQHQLFGQILLDYNYITSTQLDEALKLQEIEFRTQMY
ncbi:MAG: hypothetical protein HXX20_13180 [Chloroflexi bacterium]|nr:hypothetical protein [Chloroflexota bacterium]